MKKINFKELTGKVNSKAVLNLASIAVTIIGAVINDKARTNERNTLKEELRKEITEELLKEKN